MDENNTAYLEHLGNYIKTKGAAKCLQLKNEIKDCSDQESEDDDSLDDLNETVLEAFTTPIDQEEAETAIDEYVTFKEVITGNYQKANNVHLYI